MMQPGRDGQCSTKVMQCDAAAGLAGRLADCGRCGVQSVLQDVAQHLGLGEPSYPSVSPVGALVLVPCPCPCPMYRRCKTSRQDRQGSWVLLFWAVIGVQNQAWPLLRFPSHPQPNDKSTKRGSVGQFHPSSTFAPQEESKSYM